METNEEEEQVDLKILFVLYMSVFVGLVGFGIMIPLLPYLAISLGADEVTLGAMTTVYSLMQMLGNMVLGMVSDKIGAKKVLCFCLLGSGLSYVAFGLADSLLVLIALRGVSGFCSGTIGCTQAYITKIVPAKDKGVYLGYVGACLGAGFACGPGLGSVCLAMMGFQGPCFVAGGVCILSFIGGQVFLKEIDGAAVPTGEASASPKMQWDKQTLSLMTSTALYYTSFAAFEGMGALYFQSVFHLSASKFGAICTLSGIGACLLQALGMKKIIAIVGIKWSGVAAHLFRCVAYLIVVVCQTSWSPYAQGVLIAGGSFLSPATATMLTAISANEVAGMVLGMNQTFAALGRVLGPMGAAFIYKQAPNGMWYAAVICSLVGALLFWSVPSPVAKQPSGEVFQTPKLMRRMSVCGPNDCPVYCIAPELIPEIRFRQTLHGIEGGIFDALYSHKGYAALKHTGLSKPILGRMIHRLRAAP